MFFGCVITVEMEEASRRKADRFTYDKRLARIDFNSRTARCGPHVRWCGHRARQRASLPDFVRVADRHYSSRPLVS